MLPNSTTKQSRRELVTLDQVADHLKVNIKVARRLARSGLFGPVYTYERDHRRRAVERSRLESFRMYVVVEYRMKKYQVKRG